MLPGLVFTVLARLPGPGEDGCRVWPGSLNSNGYGKATVRVAPGRYLTVYIHRVAFGWAHGFVPPELDHACRVRACAEASHLEAVSHWENCARSPSSWTRAGDVCPAGHPWLPENERWEASSHGGWQRKCRACHRARALASYYRRKQERDSS